jgi:ribose 1,5-bisphosphokinase
MSRRLVYVVGPSGAGKDSVLSWISKYTHSTVKVHWARRIIDRPKFSGAGAEDHLEVDTAGFQKLLANNELAMYWHANSHHYGIHKTELLSLNDPNTCVVVNGSRAHLPVAATLYPELTVVHITADIEVLRERLYARARESQKDIESRLNRNVDITLPPTCTLIEISNTTALDLAGRQLIEKLRGLKLWND